jgi:hypothetical protein
MPADMAPSPMTATTLFLRALEVARDGHAEAGGDRGRGMRGAERVVFALGALGEAGEAARLAQRADAVAPAGQDLVRIGLVADVPDQPVVRRVEDMVQRDVSSTTPRPAPRWPPVWTRRRSSRRAIRRLGIGQPAQIGRGSDCVQQWRFGSHACRHFRRFPDRDYMRMWENHLVYADFPRASLSGSAP